MTDRPIKLDEIVDALSFTTDEDSCYYERDSPTTGASIGTMHSGVVKDVHRFPGHIACDEASNSEIAVPIERGKRLIGVLDLDSPTPGRFDDRDKAGLERLVGVFLECTDTQ